MTQTIEWTESRALELLRQLDELIPDAKSELDFDDPFHLLVAVMLSAQSTDKQVNKIAPDLFERFPDAAAFADASPEEIAPYIKTLGLYKNKSKYLHQTGQKIVEDFDGQVPDNLKDLTKLPGVGRKTANVVLSVAFDTPAIAVDTHVERVCKWLGISSKEATPRQVEQDLMGLLPKSHWSHAHQLLVLFGRYYATARSTDWEKYIDFEKIMEA